MHQEVMLEGNAEAKDHCLHTHQLNCKQGSAVRKIKFEDKMLEALYYIISRKLHLLVTVTVPLRELPVI